MCSLISPHPNIAKVNALVLSPPTLVLEYCNEGNLYDKLHSNEFISMETKMQWILDILRGLVHLRNSPIPGIRKSITHGSISSHNILLHNNTAKLSNMKTAKLGKLQSAFSCGHPLWKAPETMWKENKAEKSDVFAFGVLIYEIMSRKEPWQGISREEAVKNVMSGITMELKEEDWTGELKEVVEMCWKFSPEERPKFTEILTFLTGEIVEEMEEEIEEELEDVIYFDQNDEEEDSESETEDEDESDSSDEETAASVNNVFKTLFEVSRIFYCIADILE